MQIMSRRINCINIVPEEILTYNIFCRLPVKSLGQCKCVSKSWNSLISQPQFIKSHLTITSEENDTTKIDPAAKLPVTLALGSLWVRKNCADSFLVSSTCLAYMLMLFICTIKTVKYIFLCQDCDTH